MRRSAAHIERVCVAPVQAEVATTSTWASTSRWRTAAMITGKSSAIGTSPMRETLIGSVDGQDVDGARRWRDKLPRMGRDAGCHSSDEANRK
jgi:hypothetical protein